MLNTININLKTDIKTDRPTSLPIKLMSQDKNNNQFILRFTNGGESVTLDDSYTVEILTKFTKSGTSRLTTAKVRQDYATWEFDTDYITQDETVYNYVYVRKSGSLVVSADSNAFYFDVGLSEIDKDAGRVAEVYDENYQKHLDEFKENVDFEEIAQAEQARKEAEILREESYEQKVDTAIVEADVVDKVDNKVTELTPQINNLTAQLAQKAKQTDLEETNVVLSQGLSAKRDKNTKIKSSDLDTSSNEVKIKPVNVSDELMQMFSPAGSVSPVIPDGSVTEEKYANDSITIKKTSPTVRLNNYPFHQRASFLPNGEQTKSIQNAVKDIKLTGANPNKNYRISVLQRYENSLGEKRNTIYIEDNDNVLVCRYIEADYTEPIGLDEVELESYNDSGITGHVLIDWNKLVFGSDFNDITFEQLGLDEKTYNEDLRNVTGTELKTDIEDLRNDMSTEVKTKIESSNIQIKNLFRNSAFKDGTNDWDGNQANISASEGVLTATPKSISEHMSLNQIPDVIIGNTYYLSGYINPFRTHKPVVRMDSWITTDVTAVAGEFTRFSAIIKPTGTRELVSIYANGFSTDEMEIDSETKYKQMTLYNLTEIYGIGNEPTKREFEEVLAQLPSDFYETGINVRDWQSWVTKRIVNFNETPQAPDDGDFAKRLTSLEYKQKDEAEWKKTTGIAMSVPDTDRVVHTVEMTDLESDSEYEFRVLDEEYPALYLTWRDDPSTTMVVHWHTFKPHPITNYADNYSQTVHKFRTMPTVLTDSIKFAQVTDTHGSLGTIQVYEDIVSKGDVRCIIHSGDVATGHGHGSGDGLPKPDTWYTFFEGLRHAVNPDGCIIPILANIGNHEIALGSTGMQWDNINDVGNKPDFDNNIRGDSEWYYSFFPSFPGLKGYGAVHFGDYASVWQLDPGITTLTTGEQSDFIVESMAQRADIPHKLISYHYPSYPGGRRSAAPNYKQPREDWVPLFQDYKPLVMSGHDHCWSKTVPIYDGVRDDEKGIVFMNMGQSNVETDAREGRNPYTKWYLEDKGRAKEWQYYIFEKEGEYVGSYPEFRPPHELDGTTFTNAEVSNWLYIEMDYDKRVVTSIDGNKEVIDTFTQTLNPYTPK